MTNIDYLQSFDVQPVPVASVPQPLRAVTGGAVAAEKIHRGFAGSSGQSCRSLQPPRAGTSHGGLVISGAWLKLAMATIMDTAMVNRLVNKLLNQLVNKLLNELLNKGVSRLRMVTSGRSEDDSQSGSESWRVKCGECFEDRRWLSWLMIVALGCALAC